MATPAADLPPAVQADATCPAQPTRTRFRELAGYARANAVERAPYLAAAILRMVPVPTPGLGTMAVDRAWRWYIDPTVLTTWNIQAQGTAVIHEANHLIRGHHSRAEAAHVSAATQATWNAAADSEINDDLAAAGMPFPFTPITPAAIGCENGDTAERYYDHLLDQPPPSPPPCPACGQEHAPDTGTSGQTCPAASPCKGRHVGCGGGADGIDRPWELPVTDPDLPHVTDAEADLIRRAVANDVIAHHKTRGTMPGGLVEWARVTLRPPAVPWQQTLAAAVRRAVAYRAGQVDYSYRRISRRDDPVIVTPAMVRPIPRVAAVVDTSGSMSPEEVAAALGEIQNISRVMGIRGRDFVMLQVDAEVQDVRPVTNASEIQIHGRGGTDMRVGVEAAERLRPAPDVIVLLTDGETPFPATPTRARLVVAIVTRGDPHDCGTLARTWRAAIPEWVPHVVIVPTSIEAA